MSGGRRGGERRHACATKRMHPAQAREIVACAPGTRPSLGPPTRACRSSLCTAAQASVVGRSRWHRGRANSRKREEPAPGLSQVDVARLAARPSSRKRASRREKKRKEVEASVPARIQSSGLVARTSCSVAEVGRRRLVSNTLGKRAPKRAAGSSEQRPSAEQTSAGDTVGGGVVRRDSRESASLR
jgi:hypothetical protein